MGISSEIKDQQREAAVAFGKVLRRWRARNGWTQYTMGNFAASADPRFDAPSHSSASTIETGKNQHPRTAYYVSMAEFNARVADGNFRGVHDRELLDQLMDSRPITDEQGRPWGAAEFWACHAGLLEPPGWLFVEPEDLAPELSEEEAAALGDAWRAEVIERGAAAGLRPARSVVAFVASIPRKHRESLEEGLLSGFTRETVAPLWDPAANEWQTLTWIAQWAEGLSPAQSGGGGDGRLADLIA